MKFYKYHGAGNDFIIVDNRASTYSLSESLIAKACHRRFGIGADGLISLEQAAALDFSMIYYNSDGREGTMCGNGGRCIVRFASDLGIINKHTRFVASDGVHDASIHDDGIVSLQMTDVSDIQGEDGAYTLDTGSPHYIAFMDNIDDIDVVSLGRAIRYQARFGDRGVNVNFVSRAANLLMIRTYERGVEDETLACGTGITAAAIASTGDAIGKFSIDVQALGGKCAVSFEKDSATSAHSVLLTGPTAFVFAGEWKLT